VSQFEIRFKNISAHLGFKLRHYLQKYGDYLSE